MVSNRRRNLILLACAALACLGVAVTWVFFPSANLYHNFETYIAYWWHLGEVVVCGGLLALVDIGFWRWVRQAVPRERWQKRAAAASLAFAIVVLATHANPKIRTMEDEANHLLAASSQYRAHVGYMCTEGRLEGPRFLDPSCEGAGYYNNGPKLYPFFLSVAFTIFGQSLAVVYGFNLVLFVLSIVLVYLVGFMVLESFSAALVAALTFALTPMAIWWAGSGGYEIYNLFGSTLFVFVALFARQSLSRISESPAGPAERKLLLQLFAVLGLAFSFGTQTRMESIVSLLPLLVLMLGGPTLRLLRTRADLAPERALAVAMAAFTVTFVPMVNLLQIRRQIGLTVRAESFGLFFSRLPSHLAWVFRPALESPFSPAMAALAAIAILFIAFRTWHKRLEERPAFLLAYFALPFSVMVLFSAWELWNPVSLRYCLTFVVPLALLAGFGFEKICALAFAAGERHDWQASKLGAIVVMLSLVLSSAYIRRDSVTTQPIAVEANLLIEELGKFPREAVFFYSRSTLVSLLGHTSFGMPRLYNAAQSLEASRGLAAAAPAEGDALTFLKRLFKDSNDQVYYIDGDDCYRERIDNNTGFVAMCDSIRNGFKLTEVWSQPIFSEPDGVRVRILKVSEP